MALKSITPSDSITLSTQCGFQPVAIYCGTGGNIVAHTHAGDDITIVVGDNGWFPGDDLKFIKAASTVGSVLGRE